MALKLLGIERDEGVAGCGMALIGVVSASLGGPTTSSQVAKRDVISRW